MHEVLVVGAISDLAALLAAQCGDEAAPSTRADFSLALALLLQQLTKKNLGYLMNLCKEQYK